MVVQRRDSFGSRKAKIKRYYYSWPQGFIYETQMFLSKLRSNVSHVPIDKSLENILELMNFNCQYTNKNLSACLRRRRLGSGLGCKKSYD